MTFRISNHGPQSGERTVSLAFPDGHDPVNRMPYHTFDAAWMDKHCDWLAPLLDWLGFTRLPEVEESLGEGKRAYGESTAWPDLDAAAGPREIAEGIFVHECKDGVVRLTVPGTPEEGVA